MVPNAKRCSPANTICKDEFHKLMNINPAVAIEVDLPVKFQQLLLGKGLA
eukprot:CAMPEP_0115192886 /NCGR_PEP_ID=MMETSP0270-20121206/13270_1 /TAXON_ID=71861 /ORGANISM="Scrippsiella trochoidea, Strain CCMP3099" /LENGTH=49 /DNA_ID=CAMNT_0002606139 /DNA_START=654 /DNA_END=803 /DNA_ORIENTATION=-